MTDIFKLFMQSVEYTEPILSVSWQGLIGLGRLIELLNIIRRKQCSNQCPKLGKFLTGHSQTLYQNLVNCDWLQCIFEDC